MHSKIFGVLASLSLFGFVMNEARAEPVTFDFTGVITESTGNPSLPPLPPNGSTFSGHYTFDSDLVDQDLAADQGLYVCSVAPCEIVVELADTRVFRSESPVDLEFSLTNVDPGVYRDVYFVTSHNNLFPLPPEAGDDHVIELFIRDIDVLSNDLLPALPPLLPASNNQGGINDNQGLSVLSRVPPFFFVVWAFNGDLTSLTLRTAGSSLNDLKNLIAGLDTDFFKGGNMQNALANKIDAALAQLALIEAETDPDLKAMLIDDLRDKVTNDILAKSNGCPNAPDNNDWVTDCASQASVQALVQQILDLLEAL